MQSHQSNNECLNCLNFAKSVQNQVEVISIQTLSMGKSKITEVAYSLLHTYSLMYCLGNVGAFSFNFLLKFSFRVGLEVLS